MATTTIINGGGSVTRIIGTQPAITRYVVKGLPGPQGDPGTGANSERATDNSDGTYTFAHTPLAVFMDGLLSETPDHYTLSGLVLTAVNPSGIGILVRSFY